MANINTHIEYGLPISKKAGYLKFATLFFHVNPSNEGLDTFTDCSFNLDISSSGAFYKATKPINQRLFVSIRGTGTTTAPLVNVMYDTKNLVNIANNENYDFDNTFIQFTTRFSVLDTSVELPMAIYMIDLYIKTDISIAYGVEFRNFLSNGNVGIESYVGMQRNIESVVPTKVKPLSVTYYDVQNYRNSYQLTTSGSLFTSSNFTIKTDPVNRIITLSGRLDITSGYTLGQKLMDITRFNGTKYANSTEIQFPVLVQYNSFGTEMGVGSLAITSTSQLLLRNHSRGHEATPPTIYFITVNGVSYEY
jgi:hypothetical protein